MQKILGLIPGVFNQVAGIGKDWGGGGLPPGPGEPLLVKRGSTE